MDNPQYPIALANVVNYHPDGDFIVNLVDVLALFDHLLVNAVDVFGTPFDLGFYADLIQTGADLFDQLIDIFLTLFALEL